MVRALLISVLAAGCSHVRIDDAHLEASAADLGDAAERLVQTRSGGDIDGPLAAVEEALVALALGHDAWVDTRRIPRDHPLREPDTDGTGLAWRAGHLRGTQIDDDARLTSDLRYQGRRTVDVPTGEDPAGVCIGEWSSAQTVDCLPLLDQGLALTQSLDDGVITVSADFGITLDGEGCAAGGVVDVTYRLQPTVGTARRGFVQAGYQGCGAARVFTVRGEPRK